MSASPRLTLAAALAVVLTSASLVPVFDGPGWALRVLGAVAVVGGSGALARRVGLPRLVQPLAALIVLAGYVCAAFARPTLAFGVLPGTDTLRLLGRTIGAGLVDVEQLAPPVPTSPGLVLLAVLGVGVIAVVVDALAVTLRRAAVAGLPLLLLFAVPAAVLPGGLGWWPFAVGAAGWLGLLLADGTDTLTRWGAPPHSGSGAGPAPDDPAAGRVGRRIGAAALGVAVVVPALVPGLDSRLLGDGLGGGGPGGSQTTTTYNPILELGGQLRLPEPGRLLLTYRTDDPAPDYLRLTTLDRFDEDTGWSSSELSADPREDAVQRGIPAPEDTSLAPAGAVTTTIDIAKVDGPWLPTPAEPREIDVRGPWRWDAESSTVFSARTTLGEVEGTYTVQSRRSRPDPELLRRTSDAPEEITEVYAERPTLSSYVGQLLAETVAGAGTDYDRVAAIQALFRDRSNGFRYAHDTSVEGFDQPDALERFLRGQRGFCEQYSSAMAAMVRGLGIPARVAVGFTPGSRRADGSYAVTTSDAHAWPEVWFSGAGWVRFEPTPRTSSQVTTPGYTVPPVQAPEPDAPDPATGAAPAPAESGAPGSPGAQDRGDDLAGGATDGGSGQGRRIVGLAFAALVPLLLLAVPALLHAARRRRQWSSPTPLVAWEQVREDAADVGHRWRPADSPRAAADQLADSRSLDAPGRAALERLALGAERARYARPGAAGSGAGGSLLADARTVRAGLLADASRAQRWIARLAPPSTLRRVSGRLGTGTADVLDGLDAAVGAVAGRLRHPRRRGPA
ncbi:MAG: DUF3488 and transglutaminase-like domain-containing protein [Mycobacteriales bacterium]